jgi:steroid delta-isomerase-like uncharacterized protein
MNRDGLLQAARSNIEAWNRRDADAAADQAAADAAYFDVGLPEELRGPDAVRNVLAGNFAAFPDPHTEVREVAVEGDAIVEEWVTTGTHEAAFGEMPPTGSHVELRGCTVTAHGGDRRWRSKRQSYDVMSLMRQLGALGGAAAPS